MPATKASTPPRISFEFFPPQSLEASFRLWDTVRILAPLAPQFVSVTYGAGGTTRDLTHDAVGTIGRHYGLNVAAHLTCVNASREETLQIARRYADAGVREIVALRGDPPKGAGGFTPHPQGFRDSTELVAALAETGDFTIRVGAYPDPHPEAPNRTADVEWLKRKIDAGAHSAITQFFFEAETFFRFRDACAAAGIDAPIIPGILPIENWAGVQKFAARCGASIPGWLVDAFETATRDGREDLLATAVCTELCSDLIEGGVEDLHFYTLNKPGLTRDVVHALGILPEVALEKVA
ncbi:methylenetetrahydrofolate reductase [NAD(P)H] [Ovoidimarina sediminis]|uniref:methylenetetrahydrofolate reductase [NAD(P)H] n=1 Tax=Ovoidimarina sediminis TaxID=3079856 RepID=UPI0029107EDF|nr:methylenetetrahydrofolate reductase [NAD(P)H] [Rhodophyticola sp. MJ-SS7]MDU8944925.1 methylenetetrahydrofolate reductase [NAD(P)H] [Rhodophyticola sp. MJ-SS7]